MKICLYLEFKFILLGNVFRKFTQKKGSGLISSYNNQKKFLKLLNLPFTENIKDKFDVLQVNIPGPLSILEMKKARMKKIPILIWSHMTVEDAIGVVPLIKYITTPYRRYLTYVYNLADIILAPSEYTKSLLIGYGITETKIIVQSNGVDTNVFKKIKKNNSKELVIGDVGLTLPRKGVKDFVETAEYFPKNKFVWYGTKFNLHIPAESAALKNLHFAGYIDDINKAFNSLDIFFHPSYEENEGMVVLEAAAVGLPIIVRDIPVYEGWLVHNENCLKGRTNKEFETHIKKLLSNVELRKRLGESALILAKKRSIENNGKKLLNVYNQLRNKTYE